MISKKEMILYQLANLVNSMCYYEVPIHKWDGTPYPPELLEPLDAVKSTGKIEYCLRDSSEEDQRPKAIVIPSELLSKAAHLVSELDEMESQDFPQT